MGSEEWRVESGEWRVGSGEWGVRSEEWGVEILTPGFQGRREACKHPADFLGLCQYLLEIRFSEETHPLTQDQVGFDFPGRSPGYAESL